jgi:hypothetical protein
MGSETPLGSISLIHINAYSGDGSILATGSIVSRAK